MSNTCPKHTYILTIQVKAHGYILMGLNYMHINVSYVPYIGITLTRYANVGASPKAQAPIRKRMRYACMA